MDRLIISDRGYYLDDINADSVYGLARKISPTYYPILEEYIQKRKKEIYPDFRRRISGAAILGIGIALEYGRQRGLPLNEDMNELVQFWGLWRIFTGSCVEWIELKLAQQKMRSITQVP